MESQLLDLVEKIYDAADSRVGWADTLNEIADLAGAETAGMFIMSPKTRAIDVVSPRSDPSFIQEWITEYYQFDGTFAATVGCGQGQIVSLQDSGREEFLKSDFYNSFWRTSGHGAERLRSNVIRNADIQVSMGISPFRQRDEINEHMYQTYKVLLPHLMRSVEMQWRLHRLELENSAGVSDAKSGFIVVNSEGRVLFADPAAERILARGAPLFLEKGRLQARNLTATTDLRRMIQNCLPQNSGYQLRGGSVRLSFPGSRVVEVAISPIPDVAGGFALDVDANSKAAAMVVLRDPDKTHQEAIGELRERYGLTPTEAKVALACLGGQTREVLARSLGVSDATVRTHLSRIYEKTGTGRRAELVRFLTDKGLAI